MGLIRLFLALSVAVWHLPGAQFRLMYAGTAVVFFFIISGFYMAMVLTEKYAADTGKFYSARFWRLYPAYAGMCLVMIGWSMFTGQPTAFTARLAMPLSEQVLLVAGNVSMFGQDLYEFSNSTVAPWAGWFSPDFFKGHWVLIGQAWSLSTEVWFYLIAPFIVRWPGRTFAALAAVLVLRIVMLGALDLPWVWGYWFFPGALTFFLLGASSYHLHRQFSFPAGRHRQIGMTALAAFFVAVVIAIATSGMALSPARNGSIDTVAHWTSYALFSLSIPYVFALTKDNRVDRWIGDLSYPLYLAHGLVHGIVFNVLLAPQGPLLWSFVGLAASMTAALFLVFFVEVPVEWIRRLAKRRRASLWAP